MKRTIAHEPSQEFSGPIAIPTEYNDTNGVTMAYLFYNITGYLLSVTLRQLW